MADYKIRNTVKSRARMSFYTLYGNGRGAEKSFNVRMINSPCTRTARLTLASSVISVFGRKLGLKPQICHLASEPPIDVRSGPPVRPSGPVGLDRLGRDPSGLRPAILAPFPNHPYRAPVQSRPIGHQDAAPAMRAPNAYGVILFECWKPGRVQ